MRLVHGVPNPYGAGNSRLFLLVGDATTAPIQEIVPAEGVTIPPPPGPADSPFQLCVLHFNDLHGHISHTTPQGNQTIFSRIVWRLRELRRRSQSNPRLGVLCLSGGDDLVGAVLSELLGDDPASYVVHAGYHLYSSAGVDMGVVGNHDFDLGNRVLAHAIERDASFPLLAANLRAAPPLADQVYPAALLVIKGFRVGIIGVTTRGEVKWSTGEEVDLANPLVTVQNLLPAMQSLCDVLIILSHLGRSLASSTATTRDGGDVELALSLPAGSVHLIVGGHTHEVLNESGLSVANLVNGIPIVQAGTLGRFLGEVDIHVRERATVASVRLTPTSDLPADEEFERQEVQPILDQVKPILARRLGRVTDHPDLTAEAARFRFSAGESALANLITDGLVARTRTAGYPVDLAAIDASAIYGGLPVGGELTFGDWFSLMPFADTVRIHRMTGRQLEVLVNDNARRTDRPGEPHVERGFLQFSQGMRYTVELNESRRSARAIDIMVDNRPLENQLERLFLVACTSFVREAAACWEEYARNQLELSVVESLGSLHADTDLLVRDELIEHIRAFDGVTEQAGALRDGRLRIIDQAGRVSPT
jgi:2',3'-cyclic-nucleotide 2'-phosphodiesterase (5'-nucleotidase family)